MMFGDFQAPPIKWVLLAQLGGVAAAGSLIWGLQTIEQQFSPSTVAQNSSRIVSSQRIQELDRQSLQMPPQPPLDLVREPSAAVGKLSLEEVAMAKRAWRYFTTNWHKKTGLVNALDRVPVATVADMATTLSALVSAQELALISEAEFHARLKLLLQTLKTLPLYRGELPHRLYDVKTLKSQNRHPRTGQSMFGWSAIDIGRLARWLKIVEARHPQYTPQTKAIWQRWKTNLLTRQGQLMAARLVQGQEQIYQQGRLGTEAYAAYGLALWGLPVKQALRSEKYMTMRHIYGQPVPQDKRRQNFDNDVGVSSDFYILDGIESGFRAVPQSWAEAVLRSQFARFQQTQQLTAVAASASDRAPFFLQNTIVAQKQPWATYSGSQTFNDFRSLSSKAAVGWFVLYPTAYTKRLMQFVQTELGSDQGWYSGFYETLAQPNQALSLETNGVILTSLLYRKVNQPLMDWAGVQRPETQ